MNWWYILFGWIWIAGFGVSVAMHRTFSHNAYIPKRWMKRVMLVLATLSCEGSTLIWCALHRGLHHPFADSDKDPQRLQSGRGLWYTLHEWKNDVPAHLNFRSIPDLVRDSDHVFFHKNYEKIIWAIWIVAFLVNWEFCVFGLIIPTFLSIWSNNTENIVSHIPRLGYRNFNTNNKATNVWWFHPFGWGGGALHNNHHHKANQFFFSVKWFEFDPVIIFAPFLKIGKK